MKITYSKIAYVTCPSGILDEITSSLNCIAEGDGQAVVNIDTLTEWLNEEENKDDISLYKFLVGIEKELDKEVKENGEQIGEVIFSS